MAAYHSASPSTTLPSANGSPQSYQRIFQHFFERDELPLSGVLGPDEIQSYLQKHEVDFANQEGAIWTPVMVLWTFVVQCLSKDKSCAAAVLRALGMLVADYRDVCSSNSGAYCKARAKLPPALVADLVSHVGWKLEAQALSRWRVGGRRVFVVDGTTITLADSKANQAKYPQQRSQKPGLGFPILRLLLVFSLTTGAVVAAAWGPYQGKGTGESALLRKVWDEFSQGDLLLADSYFASYFAFFLARKKGLDLLTYAHHKRHIDFRRGIKLGRRDHCVCWEFPARPEWMTPEEYQALGAEEKEHPLQVRELQVAVHKPGFRTKKLTLATSLLDAEEFAKETLAQWYRQRWQAELDLRSLKTQMQMEHLRCKSPQMAELELWMHFLAYNLIRKLLCQAAVQEEKTPRELSFNFARQTLSENWGMLALLEGKRYANYGQVLLKEIAKKKVGDRPDRVEPRAVKRRPKPQDLLTKPREEAIAELMRC